MDKAPTKHVQVSLRVLVLMLELGPASLRALVAPAVVAAASVSVSWNHLAT